MAVDYFLKLTGIEGESTDSTHAKEIQLESWSWGESNSGSSSLGGGAGAGKVSMNDFNVAKRLDKASPLLLEQCANGKHIAEAKLTCRKQGEKPLEYLIVTMTDLIISSYQVGAGGDDIPIDQVSFNFASIKFEYKEQDAKGVAKASTKGGWDVKQNKVVA
jgi:type VI secretion system secreted protein Hcp